LSHAVFMHRISFRSRGTLTSRRRWRLLAKPKAALDIGGFRLRHRGQNALAGVTVPYSAPPSPTSPDNWRALSVPRLVLGRLQQPRLHAPPADAVRAVRDQVGAGDVERCPAPEFALYEVRALRGGDHDALVDRHAVGRATVSRGMEQMKFNCQRCGNSGWCCETHTEAPQSHALPTGGECSGAGIPCPICNTGEPPYPSNRRRHISGEYIDE
jgi:hypothetical protein